MARIFITCARSPAAIDWVRRFGLAGHQVAASDSLHHPLCSGSRHLERYFVVPSVRSDPRAYALAVRDAAREFKADWIIPTSEEIFVLARYREIFEGVSHLLADSFETLAMLHHKGRFASFTAAGPGIRSPESHELRSRADLDTFASTQGGSLRDWVLKPVYSRFGSEVKVRPEPPDWQDLQPTAENPWLAQRYAPGDSFCTFTLAAGGTVTAHSTYRPLHQINGDAGAGFYFESADRPDLAAFCANIVKRLGFHGQISFDFLTGPAGTCVIECNPRTTSGLHLLEYRDPLPYLQPPASGATLWPVGSRPRMLGADMLLRPGAWSRLRDYRRADDVYKMPGDHLPLLAAPRSMWELYKLARKLGFGSDIIAAATHDLPWNGEPLPDIGSS